MTTSNVFSKDFLNLNLISFFNNENVNSISNFINNDKHTTPVNTNVNRLLRGNEEFILENIDDDEDTNEPQKTVIIDERSLGSFVEGPVTMVSDVIGENDCYLSGGGYRKSREKRKREKEENEGLPLTQYPYKSIATPVLFPAKKKAKLSKNKILKLLHWNPNSVTGKINSLLSLLKEVDPDIISLNETRTNSTTEYYIHELCQQGYYPFIKNRQIIQNGKITNDEREHVGGGVALLIRDSLTVTKEITLPEQIFTLVERATTEIVGIEIKIGNRHINVFSMYNPPGMLLNEKVLNHITNLGDYILIGDLNAKLEKFDGCKNRTGVHLEPIIQNLDSRIMNEKDTPTFFRYVFGSLISTSTIDLVLVNESLASKVVKVDTLKSSAAIDSLNEEGRPSYFHLPLVCEISVEEKLKKERKSFKPSFIYDKANWGKLIMEVEKHLSDEDGLNPNDIEALNERLIRAIKVGVEAHIPKSREKLNRDQNFPKDIVQILETRNFWGRAYRRTRSERFAKLYREYQNLATQKISEFRLNSWKEFVERQGASPLSSVPFWKRINRLRANKRRKKLNSIQIDGQIITDGVKIADLFASDLEAKFKLDKNDRFDNIHRVNIEHFINNGGIENAYSDEEKSVPLFKIKELDQCLNEMNKKTSTDPLGLSNRIIKELKVSPVIKNHILNLFNRCLSLGTVPQNWKHSEVSMLLKNGQNASLLGSYRPISSTPCLARLFERLVLSRLQEHLKKNNLIITNQSGFRKDRQTKDNILFLTQTAQQAVNEGKKTLSIFFDIAGAFDKVWHQGLLFKLHVIRVPFYLIKIIANFLGGRTFAVKIEGKYSSNRLIECGVPQGGVLSPTMFSSYINDVPLADDLNEKCLLFADDIVYIQSYVYKIKNKLIEDAKEEASKKAQDYLDRLEEWMNRWHLSLAPHKCSQLTFTKASDKAHDNLDVKIYGVRIPYESNPKFLGIVFDARMSFEAHIELIKSKVKDRINVLKVLSYDKHWSLPEKFLINIYKVLVRSVMDYSSVVAMAGNKACLKDMEILQNAALRVIFKVSPLDHIPTEELLKRADVTSIEWRHVELTSDYYEKSLIRQNPLLEQLFNNYRSFKKRNLINENLAVDERGIVDMVKLELIRKTNLSFLEIESHPTTLCKAKPFIKDFIIDKNNLDPVGTAYR